MPGENAGDFLFFWSIVVPALMVAGSILVTYLLYKHFAAKFKDTGKGSPTKSC